MPGRLRGHADRGCSLHAAGPTRQTAAVSAVPPGRATVREVLRVGEFRALLGSSALSLAGDQVARVAVAVLVYERTGSALSAAATYACSYLSWFLGGPLTALADRLPRRRLMITCDLLRAALVAVLLVPGLALPVVFTVLVLVGVLSPPFDAAKSAVLPEVLTGDRYVVGNGVQIAVFQAAQVVGFLLGGAVVAATTPQGALAIDAGSFLLSAVLLRAGVRDRALPARERSPFLVDLREGVALVRRSAELRRLLGYGVLGAALTIAPEGLAVPVADGLGGGPRTAGLLTAAVPAGYLLGAVLLLRLPPERRTPLLPGMVVLSGVALLLCPLVPGTAGVAVLWALAGVGGALNLVANAAYMQAVPAHLRGRAFGVASTALMAAQGVLLLGTGAAADLVDPLTVVALAGAGGLVLLVPLVRPGPRLQVAAQGPLPPGRGPRG